MGRKALMRTVAASLVLLTMLAASAGLAAEAPDPNSTTAVLKAAGASPGGVGFMLLTGMAKWVKKAYPKIDITVVPGGYVGNLFRVNTGEMDLAATTVSLCAMAENKQVPYNKTPIPNTKSLFTTQDQFNFFAIVRDDLEANSIGELFAKKLPIKLCTLNKGTATELIWRAVFESQGVSWSDIKDKWGGSISFVSWGDAVNLVKDGHADGILAVGAGKIGWAMDLAHARKVKILQWDPKFMRMVGQKFGLKKGAIPANSYPNITKAVVCPYTSGEIIVNAKVPDKVVAAILTSMVKHAKDYAKHHKALANFTVDQMADVKLPLHPAALRFYQAHNIPLP